MMKLVDVRCTLTGGKCVCPFCPNCNYFTGGCPYAQKIYAKVWLIWR